MWFLEPVHPGNVVKLSMTKENIIFVVDDDSSARKGLARLMRTAGYDVREFASADDFLASIDPNVSGCLVLDARMPGITSEEIVEARRLAKEWREKHEE